MDRLHAGRQGHHAAPRPAWSAHELGLSGGRPLDADVASNMQARLGHDFSAVRVHTDGAAPRLASGFGARAFTLGQHIGFASGRYAPRSDDGSRLLAHELAHSLQQSPAAGVSSLSTLRSAEAEAESTADQVLKGQPAPALRVQLPSQLQFDLESPDRLAEVHDNVFPAAPSAGGGSTGASTVSSQPWQPASAAGGGTAVLIVQQVRDSIARLEADSPEQLAPPPIRTREADVDRDVLLANVRLRGRFPQITVTVSDAALQTAAGVLSRVETDDPVFLHQWLWNTLPNHCDIQDFAIAYGDPEALALRNTLLDDSDLGPKLRAMSRRVAGLHVGTGLSHTIRVNRGVTALQRSATLVHELTHMFAHDTFVNWVATTANDDLYGEGLTDWLARRAMTSEERALPSRYTPRVQRVDTEIAAHVSEDDIARAYFQGEVWRLENRSDIARERFEADSGIEAGATGRRESDQSRAGPGLTQEVLPDAHYRFLNLGNDIADPKPEHVDYFRRLKTRLLDPQPGSMVKFIGHASSPGPAAHNVRLSLRRAQAFYRMARDQGLDASRLRDETPPEHHGEQQLTLTEEDAQTRAFNRRVELRLSGVSGTPGRSTGTPATPEPAREEDR